MKNGVIFVTSICAKKKNLYNSLGKDQHLDVTFKSAKIKKAFTKAKKKDVYHDDSNVLI